MKNGILPYKSVVKYLGILISDTGNIKTDVGLYIDEKRTELTIKYSNFCKKHFLAPLSIKLQVLHSCVCSSLVYGAETWGDVINQELESLYRQGIKCALSIRNNTNNEIVYLESGLYPLSIRIKAQQINFWIALQELIANDPSNHIGNLIRQAERENTNYVTYYKRLFETYENSSICQKSLIEPT